MSGIVGTFLIVALLCYLFYQSHMLRASVFLYNLFGYFCRGSSLLLALVLVAFLNRIRKIALALKAYSRHSGKLDFTKTRCLKFCFWISLTHFLLCILVFSDSIV